MRSLQNTEKGLLEFLTNTGAKCGLLEITKNDITKASKDARGEFREFLKASGAHDYSRQKIGQRFKASFKVISMGLSSGDTFELTVYRPKTKKGAFSRIGQVTHFFRDLEVNPSNIVIFIKSKRRFLAYNLTRLATLGFDPGVSLDLDEVSGNSGATIIEAAKEQVLYTMASMSSCEPKTGRGSGYREIEELSGLGLKLKKQDGYLTWSLLVSLNQHGKVKVVPGTEKRRKFRLFQ